MKFKISSALKDIIGRELITNKYVAIFELVKNSYDAMANNIEIDVNMDEIKIIDDGSGMSKDDIMNKWLFVAYSDKKNQSASDGRRFVGAKGVGRFACDRLGKVTKIITKTKDENYESILEINWEQFEKTNEEEFVDVKVNYMQNEVFNSLSYTKVICENLREQWTAEDIEKLKTKLNKLIDPFEKTHALNITMYFNAIEELIENKLVSALEKSTTVMDVIFSDFIKVSLNDRGSNIYELNKIKNETLLKNIKVKVMYLNPAAKRKFHSIMNLRSVDYGSIFIYKNGFRIHPIGDLGNDFFGLDQRKNQGHSRYIGPRELVGFISIKDDENYFIEPSSRDQGFIENEYVNSLRESYLEYVQRPLEKFIQCIAWGYDKNSDKEIYLDDLSVEANAILPKFAKKSQDKFISRHLEEKIKPDSVSEIDNILQLDSNLEDKSKVIAVLEKTKKDLKETKKQTDELTKKNAQTSKENQYFRKQNSLLQSLTEYEKSKDVEITHHMSKFSDELNTSSQLLFDSLKENDLLNDLNIECLAAIKKVASRINVFYKLILKSNIDSKSEENRDLYQYFDFYINDVMKKTYGNLKIFLSYNNQTIPNWIEKVDVYDISCIIDNMTSNANDQKGTFLSIRFEEIEGIKKINFISDTKLGNITNVDDIFNFGFSTKDDGTGIGLYNIKKIVSKYNWKITVDETDGKVIFSTTLNEKEGML